MTDEELAASRAACIPDVPKILAAADRLADAVGAYHVDAMPASTYEAVKAIDKIVATLAAYRSLRP